MESPAARVHKGATVLGGRKNITHSDMAFLDLLQRAHVTNIGLLWFWNVILVA
jgi:hypothetical protein